MVAGSDAGYKSETHSSIQYSISYNVYAGATLDS